MQIDKIRLATSAKNSEHLSSAGRRNGGKLCQAPPFGIPDNHDVDDDTDGGGRGFAAHREARSPTPRVSTTCKIKSLFVTLWLGLTPARTRADFWIPIQLAVPRRPLRSLDRPRHSFYHCARSPYSMPIPEGKYSGRVFSRDNGGSEGLSTDTIIIIAVVCGCVVVLALSLFMWRALKRCCSRSDSAPLPPVQGLAHHRRAVLAEHYSVSSRPATWLDASADSFPPMPRQRSFNSAASLLPEKNPSLYTDDLGTAESSHSSPVNLGDPAKLYPPNRVFYGSTDGGDHSPAASQNSLPSGSPSPVPFSEESSSISHDAGSPDSHGMTRSQSSLSRPHSTRSRSQVRLARRLSQISSGTGHTTQTRRSTSTVRGAPHLTNMQIVLPAPLGPQPIYPGHSTTAQISRKSSASGFADQWITNSNNSGTAIAPVPDLPRTFLTVILYINAVTEIRSICSRGMPEVVKAFRVEKQVGAAGSEFLHATCEVRIASAKSAAHTVHVVPPA